MFSDSEMSNITFRLAPPIDGFLVAMICIERYWIVLCGFSIDALTFPTNALPRGAEHSN